MSDAGERVELRVDQLEFEGLSVGDPGRVQGAFVGELERLLRERGLLTRRDDGRVELDGGELAPAELGDPDRLGVAVARRVYEELLR